MLKYPPAEVAYVREKLALAQEEARRRGISPALTASHATDEELVRGMVLNRLNNTICNFCHRKDDLLPLFYCRGCHCTWYCTQACQDGDKEEHERWCGKKLLLASEADRGPMRVVFATLDQPRTPFQSEEDIRLAEMEKKLPIKERRLEAAKELRQRYKKMGNDAYHQRDFSRAWGWYTLALRELISDVDHQFYVCFLNRAKTFAALGLFHLAFVEIYLLESAARTPLKRPQDLRIKAQWLLNIGLPHGAQQAYMRMQQMLSQMEDGPEKNEEEKKLLVGMMETAFLPPDVIKCDEFCMPFLDEPVGLMYNPCVSLRLFEELAPASAKDTQHFRRVNETLKGGPFQVGSSKIVPGQKGVLLQRPVRAGQIMMQEAGETLTAANMRENACGLCGKNLPGKPVPCPKGCGLHFCSKDHLRLALVGPPRIRMHSWQCDPTIQHRLSQMRKHIASIGGPTIQRLPLLMAAIMGIGEKNGNPLEKNPFIRLLVQSQQPSQQDLSASVNQFERLCHTLCKSARRSTLRCEYESRRRRVQCIGSLGSTQTSR
jgi:hypothetical protein